MTPDVVKVRAFPAYILEAVFADGAIRRFDMRPYLRYPAYTPLENPSFFMRAHVANGVVTWSDEIDLAPETLYIRGERVEQAIAAGNEGKAMSNEWKAMS